MWSPLIEKKRLNTPLFPFDRGWDNRKTIVAKKASLPPVERVARRSWDHENNEGQKSVGKAKLMIYREKRKSNYGFFKHSNTKYYENFTCFLHKTDDLQS